MSLTQRLFGAADDTPDPAQVRLNVAMNDAMELLKNQRRRWVVRHLARADAETVELGDLAEAVAARENDCTPRELTSNQRKRVYVAFYQCHLPKMDKVGLIHFDKDRGLIYPTVKTQRARQFVDVAETMLGGHDE